MSWLFSKHHHATAATAAAAAATTANATSALKNKLRFHFYFWNFFFFFLPVPSLFLTPLSRNFLPLQLWKQPSFLRHRHLSLLSWKYDFSLFPSLLHFLLVFFSAPLPPPTPKIFLWFFVLVPKLGEFEKITESYYFSVLFEKYWKCFLP